MSDGLGKYLGGKVVGGIVGVCAVLVIIWYWRLAPADRDALWGTARGTILWMGCVAALPWATFFVPGWALRKESNWVSAFTLAGYLAADVSLAVYLTYGNVHHRWQKAALLLGFLFAAVYNFIVCDFLAGRFEDGP